MDNQIISKTSKLSETLQTLISFKTISNNFQENQRAIDWIKEEIRGLSLFIKEFNFNQHPSLFVATQKTKKPKLLLAAHLDVVPASDEMFKLKIKGWKIFGRGVYDMKFAIACYLQILKDLGQDLKRYDFGILITTDEEIGGLNGTKKFLENGYSGRIVFLPDGGKDWNFEEKAKGVLHLLIEARGKSIHGSRPWEGENAIETLFQFLNNVKGKFPKEPCKDKRHWHTTLNIGKIEGGVATNQVPDFARAWVDIRFPPEVKIKKIKSILKSSKNKFKNKIKIVELIYGSPYRVNKNNKAIQIFSKIAFEKFKIKTGFISSHGTSDARFFAQYKIPVILIRPKGGGHHSEKEWINREDLEKFYVVLKNFVQEIAKN